MTAAHSAREEVSALPDGARRDNRAVMDRGETIAILGAGTMARAVGRAARRAGCEIVFGARRIDAAREAARRTGPGARGASLEEAVLASDFVVLALRWQGLLETLDGLAHHAKGRTIVDLTNPSTPDGLRLLVGHSTSGAEEIARRLPGARVVKALNHVYAEILEEGTVFSGICPAAFLCGDAEEDRRRVGVWLTRLGFEPIDAGPLESARLLEPLAQLAVELVEGRGTPPAGVAFALARRRYDAREVIE
jgi:predicted dinucleotide-binding enzyme